MEKDNTLFGTRAMTPKNKECIVLYTYQNKYEDTDWFTMAQVAIKGESLKNGFAFALDELTLIEE